MRKLKQIKFADICFYSAICFLGLTAIGITFDMFEYVQIFKILAGIGLLGFMLTFLDLC